MDAKVFEDGPKLFTASGEYTFSLPKERIVIEVLGAGGGGSPDARFSIDPPLEFEKTTIQTQGVLCKQPCQKRPSECSTLDLESAKAESSQLELSNPPLAQSGSSFLQELLSAIRGWLLRLLGHSK